MQKALVFFITLSLLFLVASSESNWKEKLPRWTRSLIESYLSLFGGVYGFVPHVEDGQLSPAPSICTSCTFPNNSSELTMMAGEVVEILVELKNEGSSSVDVIAIQASAHEPSDHAKLWSFSAKTFNNTIVPPAARSIFPYQITTVVHDRRMRFQFVGTVIYEMNQKRHASTFFNGMAELTRPHGEHLLKCAMRFCLGSAIATFFFLFPFMAFQMWLARSLKVAIQKRQKRTPLKSALKKKGKTDQKVVALSAEEAEKGIPPKVGNKSAIEANKKTPPKVEKQSRQSKGKKSV